MSIPLIVLLVLLLGGGGFGYRRFGGLVVPRSLALDDVLTNQAR